MMGPKQQRKAKLFYVGVDLEERVDAGHPLRRIAQVVDFQFVRAQVAALYGRRGNPSLDPVLVLKLLFLLFYENVSSERELMRQLPCRLDWLWFLQMDLDSEIPDHSVLSKARRRWGSEVFARFFQEVLQKCIAAGLVDGCRVHIDASVITANADRDKLTLSLKLAGEAFYGKLEAAESDQASRDSGSDSNRDRPSGPPPGTLYAPSDPEARLTQKNGRSVLGYKDHRVVDDRCGIITVTLSTHAAVDEASMLKKALEAHQEQTSFEPLEPTTDRGYGTIENYLLLREARCRPCVPHKAVREDPTKFPRSLFIYQPEQDAYLCPAGQLLTCRGAPSGERYRYQAKASVCQSCLVRRDCTASETRRVLSRQVNQEAMDWADNCLSRWERRVRMRRRKIRAEGSFADAANRHGYKRARWRGLKNMQIQNLLIAGIQNTRKLVRTGIKRTCRGAASIVRPAGSLVVPLLRINLCTVRTCPAIT